MRKGRKLEIQGHGANAGMRGCCDRLGIHKKFEKDMDRS